MSVSVVREVVCSNTVNTKYQIYALSLSLFNDFESEVELVIFADRATYSTALCLSKGISHTTAKDEVVHLIHKVFNDTNLGRNLRTTHDGSERTLDVAQNVVNSSYFLLHQVAKHLMVCIEAISDNSCRSMATVSSTESIVYIEISI